MSPPPSVSPDPFGAHTPEPDADLHAEVDRLRAANADLARANAALVRELVRWRGRAIDGWSEVAARSSRGDAETQLSEVDAIKATLSWRITRPLRGLRRLPHPRRIVAKLTQLAPRSASSATPGPKDTSTS